MSRSRQRALYGEPADPVPSAGLPWLVRPRSEVAAQLGQRINIGKQIFGSLPSSTSIGIAPRYSLAMASLVNAALNKSKL